MACFGVGTIRPDSGLAFVGLVLFCFVFFSGRTAQRNIKVLFPKMKVGVWEPALSHFDMHIYEHSVLAEGVKILLIRSSDEQWE